MFANHILVEEQKVWLLRKDVISCKKDVLRDLDESVENLLLNNPSDVIWSNCTYPFDSLPKYLYKKMKYIFITRQDEN